MASPSNRPTASRSHVAVAAVIYSVLTLALTYPTIFNLSTAIVGYPGEDNIYSVWEGWWFKVALFERFAPPAEVPILYYPLGLYQSMLTATPLTELTQAPLAALFGPVVAYNVIFLLSFFLTALFTYLLCYDLTGNRWASLAGGLIFAFSPFRVIHAAAGHFTQSMTYWFPLYAMFMLRVVRKPSARDAVLAGVFMACSALVSLMHIAYFVIPFTLAALLYGYLSDRAGFLTAARLKFLGLALAVGAAITAPFFVPFLIQKLAGGWGFLDRPGTVEYAADLLGYLSPSQYHPVFSRLPIGPFLASVTHGFPFENLVYLGWVPLLLAWFGRRGATARLWIGLGGVTALLALGPMLKVAGALVSYTVEDKTGYLLLPYALIKRLPLYEMGRTPARLVEPLMLCVAVLAALGLARAWQVWQGRGWRPVVTGLVVAAIAFEYLTLWPLPMTPAPRPTMYETIARDTEQYAVLDVPLVNRRVLGNSMYYQTIHGHPIVGGYLWRFPVQAMRLMEFVDALALSPTGADIVSAPSGAQPRQFIARFGVRYVTMHKGEYESPGLEQASRAAFAAAWGQPVYEDANITVFTVPPAARDWAESNFAAVGTGWHGVEAWDGVPTRWLGAQGSLFFQRANAGEHRLRFTAYPYLRNRTIRVLVNGTPADEIVVGTWQSVETRTFSLASGVNQVEIRVVEGCEKPSEVRGEDDARCLSIAVQRVELVQ